MPEAVSFQGQLEPRNNNGPVVLVFVAAVTCFSATSAIVRLYVSMRRKLDFRTDDALFLAGLATAIAQTVTLKYAVDNGLGEHMSELSSDEIARYFKFIYAGRLIGLSISSTCSKASVAALTRRIFVPQTNAHLLNLLFFLVAAWALHSLFALAFLCHLPEPWRFTLPNCPSGSNLLYSVITFNILSDAVLSFYILPDMLRLGMRSKDRWIVLGLFVSRFAVCLIGALQFVFTAQTIYDPDQTWSHVRVAILESAVVHFSLITATIPRIHHYVASLTGNLLRPEIADQEHPEGRPERSLKQFLKTSRTSRRGNSHLSDAKSLKLVPTTQYSQDTRIYSHSDRTNHGHTRDRVDNDSTDEQSSQAEDGLKEGQSSTASLRNNVVYQSHEFTLTSENGSLTQPEELKGAGVVCTTLAVVVDAVA